MHATAHLSGAPRIAYDGCRIARFDTWQQCGPAQVAYGPFPSNAAFLGNA